MHSLAPIAGITSVSGSMRRRRSGARRSRDSASRNSGAAAVGRVLVRLGLGDRLLHRLDDRARGVGRSGSPIPRRDHVDAGRALGGDLALELGEQVGRDPLQALSSVSSQVSSSMSSSASSPRYTGTAQPVRLTCRSSSDLDLELAAVEAHGHRAVAAAQHVGDGGAARAGARGQRLPHPALEDPRADRARPSSRVEGDVGAVGEERGGARSAGRARVQVELLGPSSTRIAHCGLPIETCWKRHSRPSAARARRRRRRAAREVARAQPRAAHVAPAGGRSR